MSFLSCEEMLAAARSQNISLSEAILRSDLAESRLTEAHSREMMHHLWQVMQATSRDYDPAQRSRSGLSGGDAAGGVLVMDDKGVAVTAKVGRHTVDLSHADASAAHRGRLQNEDPARLTL